MRQLDWQARTTYFSSLIFFESERATVNEPLRLALKTPPRRVYAVVCARAIQIVTRTPGRKWLPVTSVFPPGRRRAG